ncbi:Cj0814 family flagellar-dependent secreted protein [Campylobacter estrildidarum]|uniref:Uncharacterized protein n=1 Tax=Campylobacter estrildidarum TaxID=2510189 RepID=A0A4U7BIP0_9BACT|nr:hypothetical protein [Campylobacter estrildidarum]TKX30025.1 hypothetical protein CQA69_06830 [Campylobacter estrildidarum]
MLNFNTGFGNNLFTNLNINVKKNQSSLNSSNSNVKNLQESKEGSNTSNKVLGYEVDKDGYFTSEFNKAAGIPEDIKIHSSTMESLVLNWASNEDPLRVFRHIDIAKTIGNAYKILSQVVGEDVLNSKDSFTLDEIAKFPQGYKYNAQTMQVINTYDNIKNTFNEMSLEEKNSIINQRIDISYLFNNTHEEFTKNEAATHDIFGGIDDFNTTPTKYTNSDGSITKGGLLIALINANMYIIDGEASSNGKIQGFDKSMSAEDIKKYNPANDPKAIGEFSISFKPSLKISNSISNENDNSAKGFDELFKNYKDPISKMFEDIEKFQKEQLEHLEKQRKAKRLAEQRKVDMRV